MSQIRAWLATCALEHLSEAFEEYEIDLEVLRELTDEDLILTISRSSPPSPVPP